MLRLQCYESERPIRSVYSTLTVLFLFIHSCTTNALVFKRILLFIFYMKFSLCLPLSFRSQYACLFEPPEWCYSYNFIVMIVSNFHVKYREFNCNAWTKHIPECTRSLMDMHMHSMQKSNRTLHIRYYRIKQWKQFD